MNQKPKLLSIEPHIDVRGFLYQVYNLEFPKKVKRIYIVGNFNKNTIRGMHYHAKEWKFFYVPVGSVKFVLSSLAKPNKNVLEYILTDRRPQVLIVPAGYYNGWKAMEDKTILIGLSSATLKESLDDDKRVDANLFLDYFRNA